MLEYSRQEDWIHLGGQVVIYSPRLSRFCSVPGKHRRDRLDSVSVSAFYTPPFLSHALHVGGLVLSGILTRHNLLLSFILLFLLVVCTLLLLRNVVVFLGERAVDL